MYPILLSPDQRLPHPAGETPREEERRREDVPEAQP